MSQAELDGMPEPAALRVLVCEGRTTVTTGRRVIAIDGKTIRGARTRTTCAPHLVAAMDQATGTPGWLVQHRPSHTPQQQTTNQDHHPTDRRQCDYAVTVTRRPTDNAVAVI